MTSAVYIGGKLVAPGSCPACGGAIVGLKCQNESCGRAFKSLADLQHNYEQVAKMAALLSAAARDAA